MESIDHDPPAMPMTVGSALAFVSQPLALASSLGAVVGFGWLAVLGEWRLLAVGVAALVATPALFHVLDTPSLRLKAWSARTRQRRPRAALAGRLGATLWTSLLQVGWISGVAVATLAAVNERNRVPLLLWGYTVAVGPLSFLATRLRSSATMSMQALMAELYAIALGVCWSLDAEPVPYAVCAIVALLCVPMGACALGERAEYFE